MYSLLCICLMGAAVPGATHAAQNTFNPANFETNLNGLRTAVAAYKSAPLDEQAVRGVIAFYESIYLAPQVVLRAQADAVLQKAGIGSIAALRSLAESFTELHRLEQVNAEVNQEHAAALNDFEPLDRVIKNKASTASGWNVQAAQTLVTLNKKIVAATAVAAQGTVMPPNKINELAQLNKYSDHAEVVMDYLRDANHLLMFIARLRRPVTQLANGPEDNETVRYENDMIFQKDQTILLNDAVSTVYTPLWELFQVPDLANNAVFESGVQAAEKAKQQLLTLVYNKFLNSGQSRILEHEEVIEQGKNEYHRQENLVRAQEKKAEDEKELQTWRGYSQSDARDFELQLASLKTRIQSAQVYAVHGFEEEKAVLLQDLEDTRKVLQEKFDQLFTAQRTDCLRAIAQKKNVGFVTQADKDSWIAEQRKSIENAQLTPTQTTQLIEECAALAETIAIKPVNNK